MRKISLLALLSCVLLTVSGVLALSDGWERGSSYNKLFDSKTVTTIEGNIVDIHRELRLRPGMSPAFAVDVKTKDGKVVTAHVGPQWFASFFRERWNPQFNDQVTITGSMVEFEGKPIMMVVSGKKGNLQMAVRNKHGVPVWDIDVDDF